MKIFAKRKRKSRSTTESAGEANSSERTSFASDPVVEDLLKLDPKTWNSKQRRMIKRYRQRKLELQDDSNNQEEEKTTVMVAVKYKNITSNGPTTIASKVTSSQAEVVKLEDQIMENDSDDHVKIEESSSDSDSDSSDDESDGDNQVVENPAGIPAGATGTSGDKSQLLTGSSKSEDTETKDGKVDPSHDIWDLLEKLNSKMKRTLSRRLNREGAAVLCEVRSEARKILEDATLELSSSSSKRKADHHQETSDNSPSTDNNIDQGVQAKKRKKTKSRSDWSSLPPEERLRREEQKRLQKEAAERRDRGQDTTPGFKHPLNSERRRANRRKPKWKSASKGIGSVNEHNSSGYLFRKQKPPPQSY